MSSSITQFLPPSSDSGCKKLFFSRSRMPSRSDRASKSAKLNPKRKRSGYVICARPTLYRQSPDVLAQRMFLSTGPRRPLLVERAHCYQIPFIVGRVASTTYRAGRADDSLMGPSGI